MARVVGAVGHRLEAALEKDERGLRIRLEMAQDRDFLVELYTSARWEELAPSSWSTEAKREFLAQQFALQHLHYRKHYPDAEWLIIERLPATHSAMKQLPPERWGRLYVDATEPEIRLMDIALLPELRGQGLGALLVSEVLSYADALGRPVSLHVEPNNPAQRLYRRLGFERVEQRGAYDFMRRTPGGSAD